MSKISSKNTKFERDFIDKLRSLTKKKFLVNVPEIKGKPDIVFQKEKICVFLDSDFWHGWQFPRWEHLLKNDFWRKKIETNRKRDAKNTNFLKRNGWSVVRLWEHQIRTKPTHSLDKIQQALEFSIRRY